MLPSRPAGLGQPCSDRAAWAPLAGQFQKQIREANVLLAKPFPAWSDAAYLDYLHSGSRVRGNKMIAARERWLAPLVLAECAAGNGRYISRIAMVLDQLSTQPTWNEPANDADLRDYGTPRYRQTISLDSATTAQNIAEALYLLGDELPAATRKTVMTALNTRIFEPMRAAIATGHGYWWMTGATNWNAVCLDGVTSAVLSALPSRRERALFVAAAAHYAPNYLKSFGADGYAIEGIGYWDYGFSHYAHLREEVWKATDGKIDLFHSQKAQKAALFGIQFQMLPGNFADFGDAHYLGQPQPQLVAYVARTFGIDPMRFQLPTASNHPTRPPTPLPKSLSGTAFAYFPNHSELRDLSGKDLIGLRTYYPSAGVLVDRPAPGGQLAITIKADGNGGHSHNDIGSFAIGLGSTQPVGDPGGPAYYTAQTFSRDRLLSPLLNSFGHPVPVIGGHLQLDATKVHAKVVKTKFTPTEDSIAINMTAAYDAPHLRRLVRTMHYFRSGAGAIEIQDHFTLTGPTTIEESLPTHGTWKQTGPDTLVFTALPEHAAQQTPERLQVTLNAPGSLQIVAQKIDVYGNPFTRVGIRIPMKKSGTVTMRFTPVRE